MSETCGVAVECAMNTVHIVDLIKGGGTALPATPWPRLENDDYIMSAGSARPLEDAFRIAPRRYLPGRPYDGVHTQLRELAAAL
ncbi:MAG TPA: hypothetical protein VF838_03325 [Trebonia sp.]